MTNQHCIHRAGCPKPEVCKEVGHCTSMTATDLTLQVAIPGAMTHTRSCPALTPGGDECTCGLEYRIALATEQTMHAAWRKRAEETETELASVKGLLHTLNNDKTALALENERLRAMLERASLAFPNDDGWLHEAKALLWGDSPPAVEAPQGMTNEQVRSLFSPVPPAEAAALRGYGPGSPVEPSPESGAPRGEAGDRAGPRVSPPAASIVKAFANSPRRVEPTPESSSDTVCQEADGCPTELAVLKRFWREQHPPMPSSCLHEWKYFETVETLKGGCGFLRCELCGTERVTKRRAVKSAAPHLDAEMTGYINGLSRAGNMKSRVPRTDNGSAVLNDIRDQIDQEIARVRAERTSKE